MSAIRLARGFTGRDVIVKFAGNYHGHVDSLLVAAGSAAATLAVPNSPGVTPGTAPTRWSCNTTTSPDWKPPSGTRIEIAGVIVEPVVGNMGCVIPTREFLDRAAAGNPTGPRFDLRRSHDRLSRGLWRSAKLVPDRPDLTTLGKIVGGGLPVGAYGGRADIMDRILPAGPVFQAGTLSGNPLATAAGIATLKVLRDESPYAQLERLSARLATGFRKRRKRPACAHTLGRVGSMMTLFFNPEPVVDWPTASRSDTKRFAQILLGPDRARCRIFRAANMRPCLCPPRTAKRISIRRSPPRRPGTVWPLDAACDQRIMRAATA